jgi:type I restriction enzyme, S subunit
VTRGIKSDVPMQDSGIEWLGNIPKHWNVEFARWLFREIDDRSTTGKENLLTVSHLTGVTLRSEKDVNMFMSETMEGYKICHTGDLVINTMWAWMGAMGVAPQDGIVSPAYNVYRPSTQYLPKYIDFLVRISIFAQEVTRYSKGVWSSRLRLYPEAFFQVVLPIPPLKEQEQIVAYLSQETTKIDNLIDVAKATLHLLQERRTSLISAAVTGQLQIAD